jgi:hypothetical protein
MRELFRSGGEKRPRFMPHAAFDLTQTPYVYGVFALMLRGILFANI